MNFRTTSICIVIGCVGIFCLLESLQRARVDVQAGELKILCLGEVSDDSPCLVFENSSCAESTPTQGPGYLVAECDTFSCPLDFKGGRTSGNSVRYYLNEGPGEFRTDREADLFQPCRVGLIYQAQVYSGVRTHGDCQGQAVGADCVRNDAIPFDMFSLIHGPRGFFVGFDEPNDGL